MHRGSSFREDNSRYFNLDELNNLRNNQYVNVDESTIKKIGDNAYTGKAYYQDVHKVEKSVNEVLEKTEKKLKQARNLREILEATVVMSKDLISVHPFLDGNGRAIRLLGDHILSRYNLPPSLYPNEWDLTMPLNDAVDFHIKGMRDYLSEHQTFGQSQLKKKEDSLRQNQ